MKTDLQAAMTSGVFVEFQDAAGNLVGQAVYTGWQGRPLPAIGDTMHCRARSSIDGCGEKLSGRVIERHFEVQHEDGEPSVWVRLLLVTTSAPATNKRTKLPGVRFSKN